MILSGIAGRLPPAAAGGLFELPRGERFRVKRGRQNFTLPLGESGSQARRGASPAATSSDPPQAEGEELSFKPHASGETTSIQTRGCIPGSHFQ